jgi:hypothetical protein
MRDYLSTLKRVESISNMIESLSSLYQQKMRVIREEVVGIITTLSRIRERVLYEGRGS